ncbi:MAG: ABC transporter ATP-binding protein [Candidatus Nanopelagicales bacterium]
MLNTQPPEPADNLVGREASLPVAQPRSVRRHVRALLKRHRGGFVAVVLLNGIAALAALVGPQVLGRLVEGVTDGTLQRSDIDTLAVVFAIAVILQAAFTRSARLRAGILGEWILADLREDFLGRAVALPLGTVERAGTGDLVTRVTTDVDRLGWAVRMAIPEMTIALVTALLVGTALIVTAPVLALAWLLAVPIIVVSSRWYFRRAPSAYGAELAAYASVNGAVAESVDAGRTVEAYRLGPDRVRMTDNRIRRWISWENYTLSLRTVWFPSVESAYVIPIAAVLLIGGVLAANDTVSLAQVTAAVLYTQMLVEPVDLLLMWFDELQGGQAAMARLLGVHEVPDPESNETGDPTDASIEARQVRFAYREGRDVLHGLDLDVAPGSRVAVVGPSGAGKSTLGRLLAGIHPPRSGRVDMGGVALGRMPVERVRRHVALVTQEHHVFVGTLRDNLALAASHSTDETLWAALRAVDADGWAAGLPDGLQTRVGGGAVRLTPAQAQQVALARLVLADPSTLVLDEATSLLDPRAARHLERSLGAVLDGRTVVAIAHRLHTAHDADVVAVVEDGRVIEYGSHDELVSAGGTYASLWRSWHDEP